MENNQIVTSQVAILFECKRRQHGAAQWFTNNRDIYGQKTEGEGVKGNNATARKEKRTRESDRWTGQEVEIRWLAASLRCKQRIDYPKQRLVALFSFVTTQVLLPRWKGLEGLLENNRDGWSFVVKAIQSWSHAFLIELIIFLLLQEDHRSLISACQPLRLRCILRANRMLLAYGHLTERCVIDSALAPQRRHPKPCPQPFFDKNLPVWSLFLRASHMKIFTFFSTYAFQTAL